jgi:CRISPR-associated protein Cas2
MFVILVYDALAQRDPKALQVCRRYLHAAQESVFEGELSQAQLRSLTSDLREVLTFSYDSVIAYIVRSPDLVTRYAWGPERGHHDSIL